MTESHGRRSTRCSEHGLTLVEAIVAMFVISVSIVALIGAFAAAERSAAAAVVQSQAEVLARQAGDTLKQPSPYTACATTATYSVAAGVAVTAVQVVPGGTIPGGNANAHFDCTANTAINAACPPGHTCDFGLQRITYKVVYATGSLSRTVYKGAY